MYAAAAAALLVCMVLGIALGKLLPDATARNHEQVGRPAQHVLEGFALGGAIHNLVSRHPQGGQELGTGKFPRPGRRIVKQDDPHGGLTAPAGICSAKPPARAGKGNNRLPEASNNWHPERQLPPRGCHAGTHLIVHHLRTGRMDRFLSRVGTPGRELSAGDHPRLAGGVREQRRDL
mgnify:CR=1 FL=1